MNILRLGDYLAVPANFECYADHRTIFKFEQIHRTQTLQKGKLLVKSFHYFYLPGKDIDPK